MEHGQEHSFVKETVKDRPINKKKLFRRTVTTVVFAVVFGLIACLTFILIEPVINQILNPEEITKVVFPEEEVSPDEILTEESVAQREESLQEVVEAAKEVVESGQSQTSSVEAYQKMYSDFQSFAKESEKSIATVVGISEQKDWFQGTMENENTTAGLIVAENGKEVLVLADANNFKGAQEYHVKFCDKKSVPAKLKEKDAQTGLAIYAAKLSDMEDSTKDAMVIAALGSSAGESIVGNPVIAVGAPYGVSGSLSYGIITSNGKKAGFADAIYNVLTTDMDMVNNSSGAVINLSGEVIGVITQSARTESSGGAICALGISDIKTLIAKLSNGEKRAYIGIKGMDVTEEANRETGVPYGVYVSEVITDSPAMRAGILNGDVIIGVAGHTVTSFREFRAGIFSVDPGTIVEIELMRFDGAEYNEIKMEITTGEAE
nr:trypsin-like peptidase domain-containing protein [Lachnospiraceae bacterium]